jgi:threonylcarbamoyladenosine tRNA methylthiotransferase MtaB
LTRKTLKTVTLGCKVNQYETEFVREALLSAGYRDVAPGETAELVVVNTCTVTQESDQKSRKLIRKLAGLHPEAEIVVMGCYASRKPEQAAALPQVTEVLTDKRNIGDFLRRCGVFDLPVGIDSFGERHRAYVKVQDGCRVGCAYCIIPQVRPYLLSRPVHEVLTEIRQLTACGYKEIVLTGIHLGHYGVDFQRDPVSLSEKKEDSQENPQLAGLVAEILKLDAPFRLRLSSLEAVEISDELVALVRSHPSRICPHFHLSMQSGSDEILQAMRRRGRSGPFREKCEQIKSEIEHAALTTDVIVGFPGETESQFEDTCRLAESIGFSKIHVFPFSPREGTLAAALPNQIPARVKERRAAELIRRAAELRENYARSLSGRKLQVLFETSSQGRFLGTADRYLRVHVSDGIRRNGMNLVTPDGPNEILGQLRDVTVTGVNGEELQGELQ